MGGWVCGGAPGSAARRSEVDAALVEALRSAHASCPLAVLDLSETGICGLDADGEGKYSPDVVFAVCLLLRTHLELPPRLLPQHELRDEILSGVLCHPKGCWRAL